MSKQKKRPSGIIYSTDPGFNYNSPEEEVSETVEPGKQGIKVKLETKSRGGKAVTIVEGFDGTETDKEQLAKDLRVYCGTGGSYKNGEILLQGDNRDKITNWLHKKGYVLARKF